MDASKIVTASFAMFYSGFEVPDVPTNSFAYRPTGSDWSFVRNAGIIHPPSGFTAPTAPQGGQVAFLQKVDGIEGGEFSQTVVLGATGSYQLAHFDAGRSGGFGGNLTYQVLLDGNVIAQRATTSGQPFTSRVFAFSATAGPHVLTYRVAPSQGAGDNTAFFDGVSILASGPAGGTMNLSPASPVSPSAALTLSFANWTDENLPLTYEVLLDDVIVSAQDPAAARSITAPTELGNHTLKGRIYDGLGNVTEVTQTFAVGSPPMQTFTNAMTTAGLTGPDAALNAAPHHDGVENLLKYAFNMNLSGPDVVTMPPGGSGGLPGIRPQPNGASSIFRYEFLRRIGSGLIYTPQKSPDITNSASWVPLTDTPTIIPIDATWERVIYEEPYDAAITPKCFGRVHVTLPP
jgi:hypothetical protein